MIAAMSRNRVIGRAGQLPWHLPQDLQRFKQLTMGQTLLMGRKTYQSIGRPLPGRRTLILSRDANLRVADCTVVNSLPAAVAATRSTQLFICGGGEVYRQALPLAEKIYLTELLRDVPGDTFFPALPEGLFRLVQREESLDGEEPCRFSVYLRNR